MNWGTIEQVEASEPSVKTTLAIECHDECNILGFCQTVSGDTQRAVGV